MENKHIQQKMTIFCGLSKIDHVLVLFFLFHLTNGLRIPFDFPMFQVTQPATRRVSHGKKISKKYRKNIQTWHDMAVGEEYV
jgi:hypothetical protein